MKKQLVVFVLACLFSATLFSAGHNLVINGDFSKRDDSWKLGKGWKIISAGRKNKFPCAKLSYTEKNKWSKLSQDVDIKRNTYYALTFRYRFELTNGKSLHLVVKASEKLIPKWTAYKLRRKWTKGTFYFFSGEKTRINIGWYLQGKPENTLFLGDVNLTELDDVGTPGKNFVVNPDFEKGMIAWNSYEKWGKLKVNGFVEIDNSTGSLDGKQCLKLDTSKCDSAKKACVGVHSGRFPIVPGKNYVLQFWGKADSLDTPLVAIVDSYISPFIPPHWYKRKSIMLDKKFRRYSMNVAVPEASKYPGLCRKLVFLKFAIEKIKAKVWIDNISFAEEKNK